MTVRTIRASKLASLKRRREDGRWMRAVHAAYHRGQLDGVRAGVEAERERWSRVKLPTEFNGSPVRGDQRAVEVALMAPVELVPLTAEPPLECSFRVARFERQQRHWVCPDTGFTVYWDTWEHVP